MDYLSKYSEEKSVNSVETYERSIKNPEEYQDKRLERYLQSPFAYNRVLIAEDPIEEKKKLENIFHLSNYYNLDMAQVNKNYDAISRHYFGEGTITTNNQAIKDATQAGKLSIQIDDLKSLYMKTENQESKKSIEQRIELLKAMMPPEDVLKRNLPIASAKAFMMNIPNWVDVFEKTNPIKAISEHMKLMDKLREDNPLLKGNIGSILVSLIKYAGESQGKPYIPTELAFLGGPSGILAGSWKVYSDRETASTYFALRNIKIKDSEGNKIALDDKQIRAIATVAGGLKATAEVWAEVVTFKGIPKIDKIFQKAFTKFSASKGVSTALNNVLSRVLGKGAAITGSEILTEWTQANIDLAANDFAIFLDGNKQMLGDFKVTKEQLLSTYKQVLVQTALATAPLALLGIGGTAVNISFDSFTMKNIIKRNVAKLGDDFTTKDVIDLIKEDPEFQAEIGQVPKTTIIDIRNRKEALITRDFVNAMEKEVAEGVPEGQAPITQIDKETGQRHLLNRDSEEFKVARETFKKENFDQYYQTRELNETELKKMYQETIVDFGLDQESEGRPGLTYEQFRKQRFELTSNYTNWRKTADAQKYLSTLSPAVETIQRVIKGEVVEDTGGVLIRHSEELGKIVAEAKAGGDIQTLFDYNLEKDLQVEALDSEIKRLQDLGRTQKDQSRVDQVNTKIREYIEAKHELKSSRNELSTILELVAREIFNKTRIESDLTHMAQNLQERLDFMDSPEYQKFMSGEIPIRKLFDASVKNRTDSQLDLFDDSHEEFLNEIEKEYNELLPVLKGALAVGRTVESISTHKKMVISIIQKALSNYLKLNGGRYIKSINADISKNISKPRADLIEKIQKAVNLVDGIKKEDIEDAKAFVVKNFYDTEGKPIPSIQGPNAKTIASVLMNGMDITLDSNLDKIGPKLSLSDLIHLKTEVDLLRYLGKIELNEQKKGNLISDEMRKSEFLVYQDKVFDTSEKKRTLLKAVNFDRLQAYQWGHKIFGDQGRKLFWTDFLTAFNESVKKLDQRSEAVREAINDDKYDWGEKMYETRTLGNDEFTLQDLLFMYVGRHDPDIRANLLYKTQDIKLETMTEYLGAIGEEGLIDSELKGYEKNAADVLTQDLRDAYNDIRVTYEEATAQRLGFIESYLPLIRKGITHDTLEQELAITMLRGTDQSTTPSNKNFLLKRLVTTKENATSIRTDLWGIWQDYVQKQEHYINLNEWVRKSRTFVDDNQVKATITENYDKSWTDGIKKYINDIASPGRLHATDGLMEVVSRYRHNVAIANLALKSNIILRQAPSGLLYAHEAGFGNWFNSQLKFLDFKKNMYKDSKGKLRHKMIDFINKYDPSTIKSHTEYDFLNYKHPDTKYQKFKRKFDDFGMKGIHAVDTMVKAIGWTAVYDRYLTDLGHDGAVIKARDWTALTQPSSNKLSLPGMYRHNEMANAFFMFTQQPVKLLNHLTGEVIPNTFSKDGNKMAGFYGLMALGLSNTMIWALTNRKVPDDAEDWAFALALGSLSWIPGIGRSMVKHLQEKNNYNSSQYQDPAIGVLDIVNPFVWKDSINASKDGDMSKFNKQFTNITKGTGAAFGVPSGFIINAKNAMTKEDWWAHLFLGGPLGEKK